jgi:hypothetical protein
MMNFQREMQKRVEEEVFAVKNEEREKIIKRDDEIN